MKSHDLLVFADYYLPGYKAGGPVVSISNLLNGLSSDFGFHSLLVTRAHEADSKVLYDLDINEAVASSNGHVIYTNRSLISYLFFLVRLFSKSKSPIYLNSIYSFRYSLLPLLINKLFFRRDTYISPRGEFAQSAIANKPLLKKPYLIIWKWLFSKDVLFISSSERESRDLLLVINTANFYQIANVAKVIKFEDFSAQSRDLDELRIAFVSRISPIKNLEFALKCLLDVKRSYIFDVYGPIRDKEYWGELTKNYSNFNYKGSIKPVDIAATLRKYNLFILPTKGENFGHSIYEAIASFVPVLISDNTPWLDLQKAGVGAEFPLDTKLFSNYIEKFEFNFKTSSFKEFIKKHDQSQNLVEHYDLFVSKKSGV